MSLIGTSQSDLASVDQLHQVHYRHRVKSCHEGKTVGTISNSKEHIRGECLTKQLLKMPSFE